MTIQKGGSWGQAVERPADLCIVGSDAELADRLRDNGRAFAVDAGDMFATVGARPIGDRRELNKLPLDLVEVTLDGDDARYAVAHVVIRAPWWRGGPFRGEVIVVMNAEFLSGRPMAPRGHPNDGRVETLTFGRDLSLRQRLEVWRRARHASHLPHPSIATRSVRTADWHFSRPRVVTVDGIRWGTASDVEIKVLADAAHIHT